VSTLNICNAASGFPKRPKLFFGSLGRFPSIYSISVRLPLESGLRHSVYSTQAGYRSPPHSSCSSTREKIMTDGLGRRPSPDEQQVLNFEQLTKSIFPEELDGAHFRLGSAQEDPESAIKTLSSRRDYEREGASQPDFEHEIIALAHQIIRQDKLVLPSGQTTSQSVSPPEIPARYPPIPLDKRTEHAMIWRTTELSAETFNPLDRKAKKAAIHTPRTYDNDLEPVLPPNLTRDVVEWTNRLLFNMLATRPDLVKDSTPNAPSSEAQEAGTIEQAALTKAWEWTDVLAALMVDAETSAEREQVLTDVDRSSRSEC
jgi:hypothetical protein